MKQDFQTNERLYPKWYSSRYYGLVNLRKALESIAEKYNFEKKVLVDYGCGIMPYKPIFAQKVQTYIGADIAENTLADILIDKDTGRIEIADNFADFVMSTQVLEHVEAPDKYLQETYRICKRDGYLILSTHGFWVYHPNPQD